MTDSKNSKQQPDKPGDKETSKVAQPANTPADSGRPAADAAQDKTSMGGGATSPRGADSAPKEKSQSTQGPKASSQSASKPTPKSPAKPSKKGEGRPRKAFPITAAVALALGLAVAGASYLNYTSWQMADLQSQSLANENSKLRSQLDELQHQISDLQREDLNSNLALEELQKRLQSDLKLQSDSLKQLGQQFQALAADKGKDPMIWRLAEVEYLLSVANQQLMLKRDVDTALTALQDADRRLESIADPALIPVRKLIASEITALKSVDVPDITGMALRLSSLVDSIETLPLVNRERAKTDLAMDDTQVDSFNELMAKIMEDLKGVVSIRRSNEPIEPLLPPDEQHYLSQNLGLKLEEARIALLRHDTATFQQNLADTRQWVQRYFDPESAAVSNVIATLDDLQGVDLKPPLPDISDSLRELRRWLALQQQRRSAATSLAPPTASAPAGAAEQSD
jgi:uroporphyrin-3 C-methyltransferase